MDEALDLHILRDPLPDLPDLLKGQLPGGHHPLRSQLMPEQIRPIVGVVGLGADVDLHVREHPLGNGKYPRVRDDQSVGTDIPQLLKIRLHPGQILIVGQDIGGDIHLHAPGMGKGDPFPDLIVGKILRFRPEAERLAAEIHRIRAVDHRGL